MRYLAHICSKFVSYLRTDKYDLSGFFTELKKGLEVSVTELLMARVNIFQ